MGIPRLGRVDIDNLNFLRQNKRGWKI